MNKPHIHVDLIKAWADGAQIQEKLYSTVTEGYDWIDQVLPRWIPEYEYRIKPREFEDGAWYPVTFHSDNPDYKPKAVARYVAGLFQISEGSIDEHEARLEDLKWVGEKLDIDWPEESE